jgi:hypothetical protein
LARWSGWGSRWRGGAGNALTGDARWDGVGSLAIGALLVSVAVVLSTEMRSLLIGETASPRVVQAIERALTGQEGVEQLIHLRTMHLGPEELLVAGKIGVRAGETAGRLAVIIDAAERRVREANPATSSSNRTSTGRTQLGSGGAGKTAMCRQRWMTIRWAASTGSCRLSGTGTSRSALPQPQLPTGAEPPRQADGRQLTPTGTVDLADLGRQVEPSSLFEFPSGQLMGAVVVGLVLPVPVARDLRASLWLQPGRTGRSSRGCSVGSAADDTPAGPLDRDRDSPSYGEGLRP